MGHELSYEKIDLTKCSQMITPKKTIKLVFQCLFCNSWRSVKSNSVTKLQTKKNTVSEIKLGCNNKCGTNCGKSAGVVCNNLPQGGPEGNQTFPRGAATRESLITRGTTCQGNSFFVANNENKRDKKLYHLSLHSFCFTVSKKVLVFEF